MEYLTTDYKLRKRQVTRKSIGFLDFGKIRDKENVSDEKDEIDLWLEPNFSYLTCLRQVH